jgi:hypothetical protein
MQQVLSRFRRFHRARFFPLVVMLGLWGPVLAPSARALAPAPPEAPAAPASGGEAARYTFSWPLDGSAGALKPRGGTTRGAAVTLDRAPSAAWAALREPGLAPRERDRRAILAMAGAYRVSFDFLEVDPFGAGPGEPTPTRAPYQSWGTEKVYVDQDEPGFISLVHILEMRIADDKGVPGEPMVIKHWRQDWAYEPTHLVEHQGRERWRRRALSARERQGAWVQTVYQVDESPRYASLGRWEHNASFSSWLSGETWRPLPRREWSVRQDYQALVGTNRHTVHPTGWTQEENNLKAVLTPQRHLDPTRPYLAREYGVARYERLRDADFAAADRYQARTRVFWRGVRGAWVESFAKHGTLTLRGASDQLGLFMPLFERAELIEAGQGPGDDAGLIRSVLDGMGVPAE